MIYIDIQYIGVSNNQQDQKLQAILFGLVMHLQLLCNVNLNAFSVFMSI